MPYKATCRHNNSGDAAPPSFLDVFMSLLALSLCSLTSAELPRQACISASKTRHAGKDASSVSKGERRARAS